MKRLVIEYLLTYLHCPPDNDARRTMFPEFAGSIGFVL